MKGVSVMRCITIVMAAVVLLLVASGCQRGDIKVSPVIENQVAPHAGWNIGPELWVQPGDAVKVTGAIIWVKGTDPNDIFGETQ